VTDLHRAELVALMQGRDVLTVADVLAQYLRRPAWMADAACRGMGTDVFFPGRGDSVALAKQTCASCPVAGDCHAYALETEATAGIWAGTSARNLRP
jgi:hypothetical protein